MGQQRRHHEQPVGNTGPGEDAPDAKGHAEALLAASERVMARLPVLGGLGNRVPGRAPWDAQALALRGRKVEALAALRAAEQAGWRVPACLWRDARIFDSIRNEPEFTAIIADIERDMARQRAELAKRPKDAPLDLGAAH